MTSLTIRPFQPSDEAAVVALWHECGLVRPWNDPHKDIQRKLAVRPDLFVVGLIESRIVGSVMAGYDGHRGWLYYLAAAPGYQRQGLGRAIVEHVENILRAEGCPKINLQVRTTNRVVIAFYHQIGFTDDDVLSLGKRLIEDGPGRRHG